MTRALAGVLAGEAETRAAAVREAIAGEDGAARAAEEILAVG